MKNTGTLRIQTFAARQSCPHGGGDRCGVRGTALPLQLHHRCDRQRRRYPR